MGIDLVSENHYSGLPLEKYFNLLRLARESGWKPLGTVAINEYEWDAEQHRIGFAPACEKYLAQTSKRDNYYGGDYWCIISSEDARSLANALRSIVATKLAWAMGYGFKLETLQKLIDLFDNGPVVVN